MRWVLIGSGLIATGLMVRAMVWMGRKLKRDEPRVGRTVDVFVMLPLNAAEMDLEVLTEQVRELKKIGVKGVMMDFWWSKVESTAGKYDWSMYEKIVRMLQEEDLQVQCVMSFHSCGEADGDDFVVQLPSWVLSVGKSTPGLLFQDEDGNTSKEYISIGADLLKVLPGPNGPNTRSPLDAYIDMFRDFQKVFKPFIGSTIVEVQVGVGPCGELRYPAYPLSKWHFPGIGKFQCFDVNLVADFERYMTARGYPNASLPAHGSCGDYSSSPEDTQFFRKDGGTFATEEGKLFREWYFTKLIEHGDRVLEGARGALGPEMTLSCKVSGVHWWYHTPSRAAEATTGYYGDVSFDSYGKIAAMLKKHNAVFLFTCMEKEDKDEPPEALCSPQSLVHETARAAALNGVKYGGENALEFKKWSFYRQIIKNVAESQTFHPDLIFYSFTLLRLDEELVKKVNLENLRSFVQRMSCCD